MKRTRLFLLLISARVALSRERRYSRALEAQLEGEKLRNQSREDELITVPMRMLGLYGIATRQGAATPIAPLRRQVERRPRVDRPTDGWSTLTDDERAEFRDYLADADPEGKKIPQIKQEFLQMVMTRREMERGEIM